MSHSQAELASLATAASTGKGGCWVVVGAAGPYYCGLHRAPTSTLVEAVLTVTAPTRSRIVLASHPGHHVPHLQIEPTVTWGHHHVLWKFRGDLGQAVAAPTEMDDDDDDSTLRQIRRNLERHTAQGTRRFIANHDAAPWSERMVDLLHQAEIMCGASSTQRVGDAPPKGEGLLIIDDGYLVDFLTDRDPPNPQIRVRDSRRFAALPKLAADSGTMVVVLTALEPRARALLGLDRKEGASPDEAGLLRHVVAERAHDEAEAWRLREQARVFPILRWEGAHLVRWSGQRSQPYGEMLRPADQHESVYRSLRTTSPHALPSPVQELKQMIAMENVQSELERLEKSLKAEAIRRRHGMPSQEAQSLHACICGPTGTGKTTLANIISRIYCNLGLLERAKIKRVTPADLIHEHVGGTAIKTRKVCEAALGGVLFIDEAYDLSKGSFGPEAVTELLVWMDKYGDRLAVIVAGYEDKMKDLLRVNEGLSARIRPSYYFTLRGYTDEEVAQIVGIKAKLVGETVLPDAPAAITAKIAAFRQTRTPEKPFSNGRVAKHLLEAAQEERAMRVPAGAPTAEWGILRAEDFINARLDSRSGKTVDE